MRTKKNRKKSLSRKKLKKNGKNCATNTKLPFALGDEILAQWQDGLFYLAEIKTIDETKCRCQVSFEDDSIYWVLFKHIRTAPKNFDEITCTICGESESTSVDRQGTVVCDGCSYGYHKTCHVPAIDEQSDIESEWFCRRCIFSRAAKAGGALKSGPEGDALREIKSVLPYDLNSLRWDGFHKSNMEQTYCYCAGPGVWYYKMLECYNCRQWFHEACLQCLDSPLLLGDRFHFFVCALCNDGEEYLARVQLKWSDIAALVLYNLSLKHDKRCFKIVDIQQFLEDNWDDLQCGSLHDTPDEEKMEKVLEVFKQKKRKYRCSCVSGNTADATWSMITRAAPSPSKVTLLHYAREKVQNEMTTRFLDCNGNHIQAKQAEQRYPSSEKVDECQPCTSEVLASRQAPLFPSLSMFKYLLPNTRNHSLCDRHHLDLEGFPAVGKKRLRPMDTNFNEPKLEPIEKRFVNYVTRVSDGVTSYTGTNGRLACGEDCALLGRRLGTNGRVDYLVQWNGVTPDSF